MAREATVNPPNDCMTGAKVDVNKWSLKVSDAGDIDLTKEAQRLKLLTRGASGTYDRFKLGIPEEDFKSLVDLSSGSSKISLPKEKNTLIKLNRNVRTSLGKLSKNESAINDFRKDLDKALKGLSNNDNETKFKKLENLAHDLRSIVSTQTKLMKVPTHAHKNLSKVVS